MIRLLSSNYEPIRHSHPKVVNSRAKMEKKLAYFFSKQILKTSSSLVFNVRSCLGLHKSLCKLVRKSNFKVDPVLKIGSNFYSCLDPCDVFLFNVESWYWITAHKEKLPRMQLCIVRPFLMKHAYFIVQFVNLIFYYFTLILRFSVF